MLTESAKVIAIDEDGLWVETLKQSACGACSAKSGCGQQLLATYMRDMSCIKARFLGGRTQQIWKLGDDVEIGVEENALVVNALLVYLLPLISLLVFAALAQTLALPEILVALSGFSGLFIAAVLTKYIHPYMLTSKFRSLDVVVMDFAVTSEKAET